MLIFPAIDILGGEAVRLLKGDYDKKTVYNSDPVRVAADFLREGAKQIHLVDLEGARSGETPALNAVLAIKEKTGLFCEVGGGIRTLETAKAYLECGVDRVVIGTAAVKDPDFLQRALDTWGERIAVGVDIKDGKVAVSGWKESSGLEAFDFCRRLDTLGVKTVIVTDISKDGAMAGANRELYRALAADFRFNIIASGGVSSLEDIRALRDMGLYGAIIGKAYYTGAVSLWEAIREGEER